MFYLWRKSSGRAAPARPAHIRTSAEPQTRPPPSASISTSWPRLNAAIAHRFGQSQRDRGGRGIGMTVDRDHHPLRRQAELAAHAVDDADIGLMRHQPIDVARGRARWRPRPRRHFPTGAARRGGRPPARSCAACPAAAGRRCRRHRARRRRRGYRPGCPGHAGGSRECRRSPPSPSAARRKTAPAPSPNSTQVPRSRIVEDAGEDFRADHQRATRPAGADHLVGDATGHRRNRRRRPRRRSRSRARCPAAPARARRPRGKPDPGVLVPTMMRSTSSAAAPASRKARRAAAAAMEVVVSSGPTR